MYILIHFTTFVILNTWPHAKDNPHHTILQKKWYNSNYKNKLNMVWIRSNKIHANIMQNYYLWGTYINCELYLKATLCKELVWKSYSLLHSLYENTPTGPKSTMVKVSQKTTYFRNNRVAEKKNYITYFWRSLYRHEFILYGATCWTSAEKKVAVKETATGWPTGAAHFRSLISTHY